MAATKRFLVVGHPRSGSTFLIENLARATGAEIPPVNHGELFNVYERLFNSCVLQLDGSSEVGMLNDYFAQCTGRFAGLKTIPSFHREWGAIGGAASLQFITITRKDVLSCIASMLITERTRNWTQPARQQLGGERRRFSEWFQDRRRQEMVLGELLNRLLFDLRSLERLNLQPGTIALSCEDLCSDGFQSEPLNQFFERFISFGGFHAPTDHRECFEDAELFRETVITFLRSVLPCHSFVPQPVQELVTSS